MPMLKTIVGHTSARGICRYLTRKNRALASDYINIDAPTLHAPRRPSTGRASWTPRAAPSEKCTVKACGETELVDKGFVNHYLCVKQARCPKCKSHLEARISKFGIYIQCDRGHTIKLDEV